MHETVQWSAVVGATDTVILGANIGRRRLTISPPVAGRVTITFGKPALLDQGETVIAGNQARTFSMDDLGLAIVQDVHAIADAAARQIGGIEAFQARA